MASKYYQEMQESFRNNNKSREFPAHTAKVHSVAWSCDGRRLASGSFDKTASVFILEKDRLRVELCWHPTNPDLFVTASGDKTIRIWDTIAVGNKDDVVTFIDAKTHRSRAEEQFKFEVNEISWSNDNDIYPELKPIQSINAHPSNCICIKFDPTGKYFATGSADALVSLWNVEELVCVRCFSRLDWPVRTLSFSHDGRCWRRPPRITSSTSRPLLAYACDDKEGKYDSNREAGTVKLFGLPNDS
ncbi:hypothetical protein F7725_010612 [Dissostichus mawsoni]|uniref:THO complex subunit 3 n=1 Tax=Dissostichus mawsoni TaxID=36200 RepID=A0A7J5XP36_DISMA|nr:hypothetical protein F7725_010612 [Dissostichus mawsoni]